MFVILRFLFVEFLQIYLIQGASNPAPVNETAYNTQELEECDASVNETVIYWLNGETHDIIREVCFELLN
jgi:hypothetical protein